MNCVTTSQNQTASELRVNDVLTIFLVNDVLNVVTYALYRSFAIRLTPLNPMPSMPYALYHTPQAIIEESSNERQPILPLPM